jgi:TIR domain
MARIFISYKKEDREDALAVSTALSERGQEVWWDRELIGGVDFARTIAEQLDAADLVVVLWSHASVQSQFVLDEAARAQDAGKLLPARIDDVWPLPLGFGRLHTVDVFHASGNDTSLALDPQRLVDEVERRLAAPRPPAPVQQGSRWRKRSSAQPVAAGATEPHTNLRLWLLGASLLGASGLLAGGYALWVAPGRAVMPVPAAPPPAIVKTPGLPVAVQAAVAASKPGVTTTAVRKPSDGTRPVPAKTDTAKTNPGTGPAAPSGPLPTPPGPVPTPSPEPLATPSPSPGPALKVNPDLLRHAQKLDTVRVPISVAPATAAPASSAVLSNALRRSTLSPSVAASAAGLRAPALKN